MLLLVRPLLLQLLQREALQPRRSAAAPLLLPLLVSLLLLLLLCCFAVGAFVRLCLQGLDC